MVVIALAAFNTAVIVQEFARGVAARQRSSDKAGRPRELDALLIRLVDKSRRRYGGYIVHFGIVLMFIGFTGKAWSIDKEATMAPGDQVGLGDYTLTYKGSRMEVDVNKRMVFADVEVTRGLLARRDVAGQVHLQALGRDAHHRGRHASQLPRRPVSGGRHGQPREQEGLVSAPREPFGELDLAGRGGPDLRQHGVALAQMALREMGAWGYVRTAAAGLSAIAFAVWLGMSPSTAYASAREGRPPPTHRAPPTWAICLWAGPGRRSSAAWAWPRWRSAAAARNDSDMAPKLVTGGSCRSA